MWSQSIAVFLTRLITGVNATWVDGAPSQPRLRIYFANHGSHLDFATLWAALPSEQRHRTRPVAARDYWGKSAFTRFISVGCFQSLLISRDGITRHNNPVEQMAEALRLGWLSEWPFQRLALLICRNHGRASLPLCGKGRGFTRLIGRSSRGAGCGGAYRGGRIEAL